MRPRLSIAVAFTVLMAGAARAEYDVSVRNNVEYVEHDGTKLSGDLYLPKGMAKAPLVVAVHGGGWQNGSRAAFKYMGPHLARNGFGLFAISYRLGKAGRYPAEVYDVKAAVQFVRAKAADLGADPDRIALMGASAGGHLVALVGLAHDQFSSEYRADPNAATPANVRAVVAFYGIYDMVAQWQHDQIARPRDQITEKFLGLSPMQNRRIYFEASPLSYATIGENRPRFLLLHGTADDIVDPATQAEPFLTALNQSGIGATRVVIPGAGHGWAGDPIEGDPNGYVATALPKIMRFLGTTLAAAGGER
jgi:acetyl esterase/lipase